MEIAGSWVKDNLDSPDVQKFFGRPLTPAKVENWIESGLLEPTGRAADGGRRRDFAADQVERASLIQAL